MSGHDAGTATGRDTAGQPPRDAGSAAGRADLAPQVLDCRGQHCPLPVIALARRLPELPVGGVLRVLADDPAAASDIPAWCRMRAQEFLGAATTDGTPAFDVRRLA